ncbi:NAD(P)/FAD-dependent oxidoreductase [uncultured Jatrophihabitans sp.]|uniref:NAD(P)/FAD-dependent oxidoreductase n=1 Tax=uncultured Jatrophihabitans sp. TaxID=1610747 RepID=UPI0035CC4088
MRADVVVVGGGLAGIRTCVALRAAGFGGSITLVSDEARPPYDRPPLSKAALRGEIDSALPHDLAALGVGLALSTRAVGLATDRQMLLTDAGPIGYGALVVATGAAPVRLPGQGAQLTLRNHEDAVALRGHFERGAEVVVAGAGWLGAEVATAALGHGCVVHCVEAAETPLGAALGAEPARELARWWRDVDLRTGRLVRSVNDGAVELDDGTTLPADVVVSAVGVRPCVEWLRESGLELDGGVLVGPDLRASVDGVFAVGDAARRWSPRWQRRLPGGHWDDAAEAPEVVAAGIVDPAGGRRYDPVPYFWSDQFGHKLQLVGVRDPRDVAVARREADGSLRGMGWLGVDGTLRAYLALDRPRDLTHARLAISAGARPAPGRLADVAVPVRAA